jgi:hypothetical protein
MGITQNGIAADKGIGANIPTTHITTGIVDTEEGISIFIQKNGTSYSGERGYWRVSGDAG